jgi:hypothetical protein
MGIQSVLQYLEGLPLDPSLRGTDATELTSQIPGLANLALELERDGQPWTFVGRTHVIVPIPVPSSSTGTAGSTVDIADIRVRLDGLHRFGTGGWNPEAGLAAVTRITTGSGRDYQTGVRFLAGLGPSGRLTIPLGMAGWSARLGAGLFPLMIQSHSINGKGVQALRWGLDMTGGVEAMAWQVGSLRIGAGLDGNLWASTLFDGSGTQLVFALVASARGTW